MAPPLVGMCVWLTRPSHQAGPWADILAAAGARVLCEPLLEIVPPAAPAAARRALTAAAGADIVIATSVNAVDFAWRLRPDFAPRGHLLAVGAATAAALARASGRAVDQPAESFTSEALLALEVLRAPVGRRIALLSGVGGRETLATTLRARGARLDKIALYRRRGTDIARRRLAALIDAADTIVVTSGQALTHLLALIDAELAPRLADCRLVAPNMRVVKQAPKGPDWTHPPIIPVRMSGEDVVAALARIWQSHRQ